MSGKCKYKNQLRETNILSYPYIDIPLQAYIDNLSPDIDHLFKNYIYINLNTICNEEQCYSENNNNLQFYVKKYEILEMPLILSLNTNINEFAELKKYSQFISKIFKNEIILYETSYKLIGFVTQPSEKHFVAYFENCNEKYIECLKKWYKYDDLNSKYKVILNTEFALDNLRSGEGIALFVYLKNNS